MLRTLERVTPGRRGAVLGDGEDAAAGRPPETPEMRLRWAVGDDYEVLAPLGSGTFGSVWRVRDLSLQREVALKMLHPEIARDDAAVNRFRREAQLAAQLAHPAIVPIYDWDRRGDVAWYTMELLEGGSIADLVARGGGGGRPFGPIAGHVELVLDGLAAAHAAGVVHRDLKPENVLIDRYRRWRISDFGIAHIPGETSGGATGTPAFAPPEQLLGEPQGAPADCFAMAAIVAFVLTGRPPFGDGDARAILARQLAGSLELGMDSPTRWRTGFVAVWAASVESRFADAAAMKRAWRVAVVAARRLDGGDASCLAASRDRRCPRDGSGHASRPRHLSSAMESGCPHAMSMCAPVRSGASDWSTQYQGAPCSARSRSRNSTRRILPDTVFGRLVTNSISRGYL